MPSTCAVRDGEISRGHPFLANFTVQPRKGPRERSTVFGVISPRIVEIRGDEGAHQKQGDISCSHI